MDDRIEFILYKRGETVTFLISLGMCKHENRIETDLFYKKTDSKQYLHYNSIHPRHIKNNEPFNLTLRLHNIVSDEPRRTIRLEELRILRSCGYSNRVIQIGMEKAESRRLGGEMRGQREETILTSPSSPHTTPTITTATQS